MRLFYAVELPHEVQAHLARLRPQANEDSRDYRWVEPRLMHVTLAFLGEQPPQRLPLLEDIARQVASESRPGVLRIGEPETLGGGRRAPQVLYMGVDGDLAALTDLQSRLASALRAHDIHVEDRPFRPHITLARRRASAKGGAPPGWPPDQISHTAFPLDHLTLFESRLSPRGASYLPLAQVSLASS
jgi:2'-5' RNA ligase